MYLSATLDPVPTLQVPAHIVTDAIDNYEQDDVAIIEAEIHKMNFMHFNPKTLLKKTKTDCFANK